MESILLITESFPYGDQELSFIQAEYEELRKHFRVVLAPQIIPKDKSILERYKNDEIIPLTGSGEYRKNTFRSLKRRSVRREIFRVVRKPGIVNKVDCIRAIIGYANRALSYKDYLSDLISENDIKLVYTYWCGYATLAGVWLKKDFPELRVVSRFHGYDLYNERTPWNWQLFRQEIAAKIDECFFACVYGKDYFKNHWGKTGKLAYLGTSEHPVVELGDRPFVLVSCSNVIPLKRIDLIIRALATVKPEDQIEWYHFGDGIQLQEMKNLADRLLGDRKNISWHMIGAVRNEALFHYYQELKPTLFITTSSTEGGCPVSIQEAFSMGIPCIGTAVGGIPDAIEKDATGILLSPNPKVKVIAEAIESFYDMEPCCKQNYRKSAYLKWSDCFHAEKNAKDFCKQLQELMR